jgi:multidrug efflux system membrane fusion protein
VVSDGETAHLIPASSLTLNSLGEMGVRLVNGNKSKFKAVQLIKDTTKGVWVSGLKSEEEIVIIGQEYLTDEVEITISYSEN